MTDICIDPRYCGPPDSANGGYCCGCMAVQIATDGSAATQFTLRKPPPLGQPLTFDGERLEAGDLLIADARPADLELDVPPPLSYDEATRASQHFIGKDFHPCPTCFVCGPARQTGDGLRLFPGRTHSDAPAAAPFCPHPSLSDDAGRVRTEFLWAALDCPGYFGVAQRPVRALLGRLTGAVYQPLMVGDAAVVMGWSLGREGRKLFAGSGIWNSTGQLVAVSRQVWITV